MNYIKGDLVRIRNGEFIKKIFKITQTIYTHGEAYYILSSLDGHILFGIYHDDELSLFEFKIPKYFSE